MVRTPKYQLIEDRLGIPLAVELVTWRASGLSTLAIAQRLRVATSIRVTGETVRQWLMAIAEEDGEAA